MTPTTSTTRSWLSCSLTPGAVAAVSPNWRANVSLITTRSESPSRKSRPLRSLMPLAFTKYRSASTYSAFFECATSTPGKDQLFLVKSKVLIPDIIQLTIDNDDPRDQDDGQDELDHD